MFSVKVLQSGNIHACAEAAAMSYNKDLSKLTEEQITDYVKRIWDKHTNVSEHFVARLEFTDIPRLATLLFAFQRDGITITEMSQRRCTPAAVSQEYEDHIRGGMKLEDARKCLPVSTPSRCVITLNREAARNIARIFRQYENIARFQEILEPLGIREILAKHFMFELDITHPFDCPKFEGSMRMNELRVGCRASIYDPTVRWFLIPMYSFHQLCRHRKIRLDTWMIDEGEICNDTLVAVECRSFHWRKFAETRCGNDTQEPLRTIARGVLDNE